MRRSRRGDAPIFEDEFLNRVEVWDSMVEGNVTATLGKGNTGVVFEHATVEKNVSITTEQGGRCGQFRPRDSKIEEWAGGRGRRSGR